MHICILTTTMLRRETPPEGKSYRLKNQGTAPDGTNLPFDCRGDVPAVTRLCNTAGIKTSDGQSRFLCINK